MPAAKTPTLTKSITAIAPIAIYQPVKTAGAVPAAGESCLGFATQPAAVGELVPIDVDGSTVGIAGAVIAFGQSLQIGSAGTLVPKTSGRIVGRALNSAAVGDQVEVLLDVELPESVSLDTNPLTGMIAALSANGQQIAQTVYPPLVANDPASATSNTTLLNALAAALATTSNQRVKIVFPDGEVYYNGPVTWSSYKDITTGNGIVSVDEARWPEFGSNGLTTFVYSGAQIDTASWQFQQGAAGTIATDLRLKNIRFKGPGVSVTSALTTTTSVGASATTVNLAAGASVAIGNAIAISADTISAGAGNTSMPWWATVTGVSGTNPVVVTFQPATPTNFAAAIGNTVQIFRQGKAVQVGGIDPSNQDITFNLECDHVSVVDWFTGFALNDVTSANFIGSCTFNRVMYGAEYGYNIDLTNWHQPALCNQLSSQSGTVTSGSSVVTGLSSTAKLKVGMSLGDVTAPATAKAFPEWACIQSVNSATQVTMTHTSSLTGSRTFQPAMGWLIAFGSGGSPYCPAQPTYGISRQNADVTRIVQPILNQAKGVYLCDSNTNSSIVVEDAYIELSQRIAIIGNQGGSPSAGSYVFRRINLSSLAGFTGEPIETLGGGVNFELSDFAAGGTLPFYLLKFQNSNANTSVVWNRVNVPTTKSGNFLPNTYYFNGMSINKGACGIITLGSANSSGLMAAITASTATTNQEADGWDGVNITLNASTTLANQPTGTPTLGKKYRVAVKSSGAYTFSMGTNFVDQAGTAIASRIAASASGKTCVMDFVGDGSRYLLIGGTLSAGLPVFV